MSRVSSHYGCASPRRLALALLVSAGVTSAPPGCGSEASEQGAAARSAPASSVHYLEIVTSDVDSTCALYESLYGVSFGPPDDDLGKARAARRADGSMIGVRAPLASHEAPITRAYLAVDDIRAAANAAAERGATVAYPPTQQGEHGWFAIVIQGDVQHGLWQP